MQTLNSTEIPPEEAINTQVIGYLMFVSHRLPIPAEKQGAHLKIVTKNTNAEENKLIDSAYQTMLSLFKGRNRVEQKIDGDKTLTIIYLNTEEDTHSIYCILDILQPFREELQGSGIWYKSYYCYN